MNMLQIMLINSLKINTKKKKIKERTKIERKKGSTHLVFYDTQFQCRVLIRLTGSGLLNYQDNTFIPVRSCMDGLKREKKKEPRLACLLLKPRSIGDSEAMPSEANQRRQSLALITLLNITQRPFADEGIVEIIPVLDVS